MYVECYMCESSNCIAVFGLTQFPLALKVFAKRNFPNVLVFVIVIDTTSSFKSFTYFHVSHFTPAVQALRRHVAEEVELIISHGINFHEDSIFALSFNCKN